MLLYSGPRIVVTDNRIITPGHTYLTAELGVLTRLLEFAHPARKVAMICGAIELVLAVALTPGFRAVGLLGVGLAAAIGLAVAILLDGRRNPRWMVLRAIHHGHLVTLFTSREHDEFEQVRRAVIRAVEAHRW
ncbi:DUF6232 family protein [Actinoplanes sp. NPDC049599]|uniref:DUF6232 family protein n=1 Tax=Actinoplanes sp. NPDC049599 TaxID=3363903 RepID=UPI0037AD51AC